MAKGKKTGGRNPGVPNKSTTLEQQLREKLGPLVGKFWASVLERDAATIAADIACTLHEATKIQVQVAKDASPYVVRKLPQDVSLSGAPDLPPVQVAALTEDQARAQLAARLGALMPGGGDGSQGS